MRELAGYQLHDPARGPFIVKPKEIGERLDGRRIYVAPTGPHDVTYSNSIQFTQTEERD